MSTLPIEPGRKASRRYQRDARSRPDTKVELQFVQVKPGGKGNATTQTIIRANAAHFHWRQNRPPRENSVCSKQQPASSQTISRVAHATSRIDQQRISSSNHVEHAHSHVKSCNLLPVENSAQLHLEVLDPLSSYICELPRDFVNRCITLNAKFILPTLFPDAANDSSIVSSMLQLPVAHSPILHLFIIGALLYSQGTHEIIPGSPIALSLFRFRSQIVQQMSVAIRDPVEACKDVTLFAILALANKGKSKEVSLGLRSPRQGPLGNLQSLNTHALTEPLQVHFDGLAKVIKLKGGLEKIKMPGLASLISLSGLRIATQDLTMPQYPVVTLSCPAEDFKFLNQGVGFSTDGIDDDINRVLSMLKSYTVMIDDFCEGRKIVPANVLIDHRNTTQHALLSLLPRGGSSECYRLAALIYSLLVTFPLPRVTTTFQRLGELLKMALLQWNNNHQLLVWVLAMGGIGTVGFDQRKWFLERFRQVTTRLGIKSWDDASTLIKRGLWFEATNERDGIDLWLESQSI